MRLLHRLFSTHEHSDQDIEANEQRIAKEWSEYLETIPKKRNLIDKWHAQPYPQGLLRLLNTGILNTEDGQLLCDEVTRDLHIRTHARHIHSLDRLFTSLYDFETRHEYVHGVLAHLHAVLAAEMHLLQLLNTNELEEEGFIRSFRAQLDYEEQLVHQITELVRTFPTVAAELLAGIRAEPTINKSELYDFIKNKIDEDFRGYGEIHSLQAKVAYHSDIPVQEDIHLAMEYLKDLTEQEAMTDDPDKQDIYQERFHDLDMYLLNRPSFAAGLKAFLEHKRHATISDQYVQAFVAAFREGFHEYKKHVTYT